MTNVIIHGLRRSGTTILWETLRSAPTLACYDEPFHPRLAGGAKNNHKGTWTEFEALLQDHPLSPVPILPREELDSVSTAAQVAWLGSLCGGERPVVIDIVRGWNRAPDLHAACGNVLSVHLVRDPASWVAAHLLPSGGRTFRRAVADHYRKLSFFSRRRFYNNYQYQEIIETALEKRHRVFEHVALSHEALRHSPAYMKLLAFWWGANCTLARNLAERGRPCLTMTLAEFSRQPDLQLARIAKASGWSDPLCSTAAVRVGRPTYGASSPKWKEAARQLGLPHMLFAPGYRTADEFEALFRMEQSAV